MEPKSHHIKDISAADFPQAVLQRSRELPVVVDFWAEWCGPCKVLGPLLEKVTRDYDGAFELAKVDVDENQQLAMEFGVQGIPTVVAFRDGAPVSRFTGAMPEAGVREWVEGFVPTEIDFQLDEARSAALGGDAARAEALFRDILAEHTDQVDAGAGLASLLISRGEVEEALDVLSRLTPTAEVERLMAAARIAASRGDDITALETLLDTEPEDEVTRLELGRALVAKGEFEPGLDHMLKLVRGKGQLKDEARRAMLDVFGVLGDDHPLTRLYRRQLASALF